jgi:putative FmdB family regulatory protein
MTYDYKCTKCGKVSEKVHGMNELPLYLCCKERMVKLFSNPLGIHGANTGKRTGT